MSQINLKYPTNLPAATLVADAYQAPGGSVDSVPTLTQANGESVSAALEIQSVLGGFVLPRMTTAQRLALNPTNGMEVYDITLNSFFAYEAGSWLAGGGAVSSISQGANIVLTPNPITTTGTVALATNLTGLSSVNVNGLFITGTSIVQQTANASIAIEPKGTGSVIIANTGNAAAITLFGANNTDFIEFQTGNLTTSTFFTLPLTDGTSGQALTTSGTGVLSFTTVGVTAWTDVIGTSQTLAINNGYVTDSSSNVTYTLPATAALGNVIIIDGKLGLTSIHQNAGQQILIAGASSTVGTGGSASGTNVGDCITLRCITGGASCVFRAESIVGNWNLV